MSKSSSKLLLGQMQQADINYNHSRVKGETVNKEKIKCTVLLLIKITLVILILLALAFFTYRLIEGHIHDLNAKYDPHYHSGMGLYIFASGIVLLVINAILTVIAIIGFLIAERRNKSQTPPKKALTFRHLAIAPWVSQALYVAITFIVINIK